MDPKLELIERYKSGDVSLMLKDWTEQHPGAYLEIRETPDYALFDVRIRDDARAGSTTGIITRQPNLWLGVCHLFRHILDLDISFDEFQEEEWEEVQEPFRACGNMFEAFRISVRWHSEDRRWSVITRWYRNGIEHEASDRGISRTGVVAGDLRTALYWTLRDIVNEEEIRRVNELRNFDLPTLRLIVHEEMAKREQKQKTSRAKKKSTKKARS